MNNVSVIEFNYNKVVIPFEIMQNDVMIDVTMMAKACGKRVNNYTQNLGFRDLVNAVSSVIGIGIPVTGLVKTIQGGSPRNQGTWMHEYIAISFSKWLDPKLSLELNKFLINTRIRNSPERITSYNREVILDYLLDLVDILGLQMKESDEIEIVNDGQGITKFVLGDNTEFTKDSLLSMVLRECDYSFTLKTIDMLFKNFVEKSDKDLITYFYYILPTVLDNLSYSKMPEDKNQKTYLMKDSNTGYTKIGKAINPKFRERTLQSEKPSISLFAVCESLVEQELHDKYKDKKIRGEWFDLGTKEIDEILDMYKFVEISSVN